MTSGQIKNQCSVLSEQLLVWVVSLYKSTEILRYSGVQLRAVINGIMM